MATAYQAVPTGIHFSRFPQPHIPLVLFETIHENNILCAYSALYNCPLSQE